MILIFVKAENLYVSSINPISLLITMRVQYCKIHSSGIILRPNKRSIAVSNALAMLTDLIKFANIANCLSENANVAKYIVLGICKFMFQLYSVA